jgi:hypothetical protein
MKAEEYAKFTDVSEECVHSINVEQYVRLPIGFTPSPETKEKL